MKLTPSFWTICKLWFFYLLPFWAAVPKIGELEEADCIFVQAFGRNNYTDAELGRVLWDLRTEVRLSDLDAFNLLAQRAVGSSVCHLPDGSKLVRVKPGSD